MKLENAHTEAQPLTPLPRFPVVGIGASAGGLDAFKKLISAIPSDSGIAYVLVQHLDASHESSLPALLQTVTNIPVVEIDDNIQIRPNHIFVIPSNKTLVTDQGHLQLFSRDDSNKFSTVIDVFFTSLAKVYQTQAIGVVLSGTASDGTQGLKVIKDYGGITFAQDQATAAFKGMPNSAVQAGVVDFTLPPEKIPLKILELKATLSTANTDDDENVPQQDEQVYRQIISLLRLRKGTDFTYYKQTTIHRRILRRMALNKAAGLIDYLKYLRDNKAEQDILYQDLLIPVTEFFRDPNSFDYLCKTVFPQVIKNKTSGEPVRFWAAGCSTGEEAYSLAICLKEILDDLPVKVQIFATDISEPAIIKARSGVYGKNDIGGLSEERLQHFFTKTGDKFQINKGVRDMCIFSVHNFLKDPPFSKMDFISCRNALIYMQSYLQKKALTTFHYALNPTGFLLLGKSETISHVPELFSSIVKTDKLFSRKDVPARIMMATNVKTEQYITKMNINYSKENTRTDFQKASDEAVLNKYDTAGVVVNESLDVVHFRGFTGNFLEMSPGKPTLNLLKLAKNGLSFELRNLLHKAAKEKTIFIKEDIAFPINNEIHNISIEAIPLPNTIEPHFLILFHDQALPINKVKTASGRKKKTGDAAKPDEKDLRIQLLEQELAQNREDMRGITEDQEAMNEELQSSNEELLSGSEELQSLNEELETGKEELQSTNEELLVINAEMITLISQLQEEKNYAQAIVETVRNPLLVLDGRLRVKTGNSAFYKYFLTNESETGGKLVYELQNSQWDIPGLKALLEKILPEKSRLFDFEVRQNFSTIGERIILLNARELVRENDSEKLILLAFDDITEQRNAIAHKEAKKHFQFIADAMPQKVWTADADGNINYFNSMWLQYTGLQFEDLKNRGWKKVIHPDDLEENEARWKEAIQTGNVFEMEHRFLSVDGVYKWHLSRGVAYRDNNGKISMWVGTNTEIHQQKEQKNELEKAVRNRTYELKRANEKLEEKNEELKKINNELDSFAYASSHDLQEPLRKIQTFAKRIMENEGTNLSPTSKDYFTRMRDAAHRMQILIEDLLSFSRINTSERVFEVTSLAGIIDETLNDFKEVIEEKKAVVKTSGSCSANIIVFQFRQLMQNLISNALKFSKQDVPPIVTISCESVLSNTLNNEQLFPEKSYCHITVQDNGIGFEPEFKEKIFEVFERLNGRNEYAGTGIGLAIVKKIVNSHKGIINATSELNKGARFDVYIPES